MHVSHGHDRQDQRHNQSEAGQRRREQETAAERRAAAAADPALGDDGSGRQHRREQAVGVVRLAGHPGQHVDDDESGGDGKEAQFRRAPEPDAAGDQQRRHEQARVDQLGRDAAGVGAGGAVLLMQGRRHGELRPAVRCLPDQVGSPERSGHGRSRPRPHGAEHRPVDRDGDAGQQSDQQQDDDVVVLEPEPGGRAGAEPPVRPVAEQRGAGAQHDCRPGEQVQRRGVPDVVGADQHRSARGGEGGEYPAETAGAEQRREPGRHENDCPARERRDDPDRRRSDSEHAGDAGEQRGDRRLVDVAEGQMMSGGDEVQLVLHEAVPAADSEFGRDEHGRDQPDSQRHPIGSPAIAPQPAGRRGLRKEDGWR